MKSQRTGWDQEHRDPRRAGAGAVGLGLPGQMAPNAAGSRRAVVDPARSRNGQLS